MKQFAGAILGVAVGASVAYLAIPEQPAQPPAQQQASADADRLAALEARVQAMQVVDAAAQPAHVAPAATRESPRVSIEANVPEEVRVPIAGTGDEGRRALAQMINRLRTSDADQSMKCVLAHHRIPLLTQYLENWPGHEGTKDLLSDLCQDYRATSQYDAVVQAIDRFGAAVGYTPWEQDKLRLGGESKPAARIVIAERLQQSTPASEVRTLAWVKYSLADNLAQVGRRSEALAMLDALVAELGSSKEAATYIKRVPHLRERILAGK